MKELLKNKWTWIVFILILVNIASLTSLWMVRCTKNRMGCENRDGGGKSHFGRHHGFDEWEDELNLTSTQKVAFEELRVKHFKTIDSSFEKMRKLRQDLISCIGKPQVEADKILNLIGLQEMQMQRNMYLHFSKLYAICDDKQKVILKEKLLMLIAHKGRRHHMMGNGPNDKCKHFQNNSNRQLDENAKEDEGFGDNEHKMPPPPID